MSGIAERAATDAGPKLDREIAAQWDHATNGSRALATVSPNSRKVFSWTEPSCGHQWNASPIDRQKRHRWRCPVCETILDSFAYHYPELAEEWSTTNPTSPWHVRPTSSTSFIPEWVCAKNNAHKWHASLASRTAGSGCPECKVPGKSAIELAYYERISEVFGSAASGRPVRDEAFRHRGTWHPDISVSLPDARQLYVEYDGSYWHATKAAVDTAKTQDLLAAGGLVVRLREHPLPGLSVDNPRYLELTVYSTAPAIDQIVDRIASWTGQG